MVYRSEEAMKGVVNRIHKLREGLPFPHESLFWDSQKFGRTHCLVTGDESLPPLVLLHGTSANFLSWAGYMAEWRDGYRIYALDLPGQPGLSSPERPPLGEMSMWLEEAAGQLGLNRFFLCGMSLGGWTALRYTLVNPDAVRALALIAPSGLAAPRASFFLRILPLLFLGKAGARRINRIVYGPMVPGQEEEAFGLLVSASFKPLAEAIPLFSEQELSSINLPLYYAGGEKDALLNTAASVENLKLHVKGAVSSVLPGMGHVILDRAGEIGDFFEKTGSQPMGIK
jgi:pimeloyl-ACP methyl ester carboxylesterase